MNFKSAYISERTDVLSLIPSNVKRVLDVGCSTGVLGRQIKQSMGITVIGIEMDQDMAIVAEGVLDKVYCVDIEKADVASILKEDGFDCIIFADVLEHTRDPWNVLRHFLQLLKQDGYIIASIPNVRHLSTIKELLFKGKWPYRERGIHDKTHLRFFTLKNIIELFEGAGLEVLTIRRKFRLFERRSRNWRDKLAELLGYVIGRELFVFQYLIQARRKGL